MSMEKQAEAAAQFQQTVFTEAYIPMFIEKCAQVGISINSEDDLLAALETAGMLKAAQAELQAKGVDTNPSPKKAVRDLLKQAMFGNKPAASTAKLDVDSIAGSLANLVAASA